MSWDNTVRCSYCYGKGHNRAGCVDLRENMQKRLVDNPSDPYALHYFEKKKRSSNRTCSYCGGTGHNRKTCKDLKFAKATAIQCASEWREKAIAYFKRIGLGIGSLIRYNNDVVGMIVAVRWHAMDHRYLFNDWHEERVFHISNVRNPPLISSLCLPIPKDETHAVTKESYDPWHTIEVVGPISEKTIAQQIPNDWLAGTDCVGEIFDKDTKPYNVSDWVELQGFYK